MFADCESESSETDIDEIDADTVIHQSFNLRTQSIRIDLGVIDPNQLSPIEQQL